MKSKFIKIFAVIAYSVLILFLFRKEVKWFIAPDPEIKKCVLEEFDYGKFTGFASIKLDGLASGEKGLYLQGKSRGSLLYSFQKEPQEALTIYVRSYSEGAVSGFNSEWKVSFDGKKFEDLASNIRRFDKRDFLIDLIDASQGKRNVFLRVDVVNENENRSLTLNWLEIKLIDPTTLEGSAYHYPEPWLMSLFLFLLATPVLYIFSKKKSFIFICLILLTGFYLRYQNLTEMIFTGLETDPVKSMQYARQMRLFTADGLYSGKSGYRGPFFPFISKLFHTLLGYSASHQRFVSVFLSLVAILLTYKLGKKMLNYKAALALSLIMAVNPPLIYESSRGNRFELIIVLTLICVYFLLVKNYASSWRRAFTGGLAAGLLGLTFVASSLGSAVMAIFALPLFEKRFSRTAASIALYLLVICALIGPHLYNKGKHYRADHFPKFSTHLESSGTQRLPIDRQIKIKSDNYQQEDLSYFDYVFKMHSLSDVAVYHLKGYAKALLLQGVWVDRGNLISFLNAKGILSRLKLFLPSSAFIIVNLICILGMAKGIFVPRFRVLVFGIMAYLLPVAFMFGWRVFEFHRYIMHVYPLYLFCGASVFIDPGRKI